MFESPDSIKHLSFGEMREGIKNVRLKGFPDVRPYQFATITVEKLDPNYLHPVQNYVLKSELMKVKNVRDIILDNFGINILDLNSSIDVVYGKEIISVLPVIVEEHIGNDARIYNLIGDGAHRAMIARLEQSLISCVYIRGINKAYPYYAKPRNQGWENIDILEEIPSGYLKKWYAVSEPKKYYRDFNSSIFHNVGQGRGYSETKKSLEEIRNDLSKAGREAGLPKLEDIDIYDYATEDKIKELREATGEGMFYCKQALIEAKGDLIEAVEILKRRGVLPA